MQWSRLNNDSDDVINSLKLDHYLKESVVTVGNKNILYILYSALLIQLKYSFVLFHVSDNAAILPMEICFIIQP